MARKRPRSCGYGRSCARKCVKGKRVALIGGGIVLAYLVFRWYRNRTAASAQTGSQTLASIPGGNVPIMSGGGGTTVNPTATVSSPASQVTTFSTVQQGQ